MAAPVCIPVCRALHPTLIPPFNTAIVAGYHAIVGAKVKLGSWHEYLAMREGMLRLNDAYRSLLSNDLGALAGVLFDLGSKRYPAPPRADEEEALSAWLRDLATVREEAARERKLLEQQGQADTTHTLVQACCTKIEKTSRPPSRLSKRPRFTRASCACLISRTA